jgi:antitoxin component YwqK of YwqJK toxin-antitoxin module
MALDNTEMKGYEKGSSGCAIFLFCLIFLAFVGIITGVTFEEISSDILTPLFYFSLYVITPPLLIILINSLFGKSDSKKRKELEKIKKRELERVKTEELEKTRRNDEKLLNIKSIYEETDVISYGEKTFLKVSIVEQEIIKSNKIRDIWINSENAEDYKKNLFQSYLQNKSFKINTDKYLITGIVNVKYKNSDVIFYKKHFLNGELEYEVFYYFDGELMNGKESLYHDNGNLMAEFIYKDGVYNGINKHYYENGDLEYIEHYEFGKKI